MPPPQTCPEAYRAATDGMCIGPDVGSCGAAAYLRKPVFISDVFSHPNWSNFRDVVLHSGLRAAWSTPIMSHDGGVLGTFCMYYREVRHPSPGEIQLIDYASRIAGIAIERDRSQSALTLAFEKIKTNEERFRLIVDTIPGFVFTLSAAGEVCGATQRSNTDPSDRTSPAIPIGPHWMITWPFDAAANGLPTTVRDKGAWVMFAGTPYAYLHVCGTPWEGNEYHDGDKAVWTMSYARH
jgi:hypothetical protein